MAIKKETVTQKKARAREVYARLVAAYPDAKCTLEFQEPFQLLIMTILAAQCTDARVNIVCKDLFRKYKGPRDFVAVPLDALEKDVQPCGFYKNKAKNIKDACTKIMTLHGGEVPRTMEELVHLGGVGRKTANVVLGECFGHQGVIVDTHCTRLANRLGFARGEDPVKLERDLEKVWPPEHWTMFSHLTVHHGRAVCQARKPMCSQCVVRELCPYPETKEGRERAQ